MEKKLSLFNAAVKILRGHEITSDMIEDNEGIESIEVVQVGKNIVFYFTCDDYGVTDVFGFDEGSFHGMNMDTNTIYDRLSDNNEFAFSFDEPLNDLEKWVLDDVKENMVRLFDGLSAEHYNKLSEIIYLHETTPKVIVDYIYNNMYEHGKNWYLGEKISNIMDSYYDELLDFSSEYYSNLLQSIEESYINGLSKIGVQIDHFYYRMEFSISAKNMLVLSYNCRDCQIGDILYKKGVWSMQAPSDEILYMEAVDMNEFINSIEFSTAINKAENAIDEIYDDFFSGDFKSEITDAKNKLSKFDLTPLTTKPIPFKMGDGKQYFYLGYNVGVNQNIIADNEGKKYRVPTDRLVNLILNTRLDL